MLLRGGYVRELAAASDPHIHGDGGDFPSIAGGGVLRTSADSQQLKSPTLSGHVEVLPAGHARW